MKIEQEMFATTPEGDEIRKFIISNDMGMTVSLINFGAILASLKAPDKNGEIEEITLGFDTLEGYISDVWFFGSTIGRYANRIARGKFSLDGVEYQLACNSPPSHLHGGNKGFNKVVWESETLISQDSIGVVFFYESVDGEEGYPGKLFTKVTYTLNNQDEIIINYLAEADTATPINMTNHTYWNLKGTGSGNVLDQELTLNADHYLPTDEDRIPTGEIRSVFDTPMDFTRPSKIGARIGQIKGEGYNHCYVLNKQGDPLALASRLYEPINGRVMEVYTTEPGIQFYTGHFLDNYRGAGGIVFNKYDGVCLEAQHFPNSVNEPRFPSTILRPGDLYRQTTIHRFFTT
jgi:aldose 1-epimerase